MPNLDTIRARRLGFDYLDIDNKREPFDKLEVRQALQYALDRDEFLAVCTSGLGTLISPVPPALEGLRPRSRSRSRSTSRISNKAKELLAKAGVPNGFKTSIDIVPTFATMVTGAQVLADQVKKIGIELEIKQYEYGVWLERVRTRTSSSWPGTSPAATPIPTAAAEPPALEGRQQPEQLDRHRDRQAAGTGQGDHRPGEAQGALRQRPEGAGPAGAADLDVLQRPDPRHEEDGQGVRVAPVQLLPGPRHDLARSVAASIRVLDAGLQTPDRTLSAVVTMVL